MRPPQPQTDRIDWHLGQLDALRGIAFLAVLAVHSYSWDPPHMVGLPLWLRWLACSGQRGVQLFFIVSAFTLFMSNRNRPAERNPNLNFAIRRVCRIAPMYYLAMLITWLLWPAAIMGGATVVTLHALLLAGLWPATIVGGALAGWSVATECAFYCTLPFLFRWLGSPGKALAALLIAAQAVYWLVPHLGVFSQETWYFFGLFGNMPVFMAGIVVFQLWQQYCAPVHGHCAEKRMLSCAALVLGAVLYVYALPFNDAHVVSESLIVCLLLVGVLLHPWRLLVNRYTILLGKISFSMYLLHPHTGKFVERLLLALFFRYSSAHHAAFLFLGKLGLTFLCTLPLAWLTYRFVETPGILLGRRIIRQLEHTRMTVPAFPRLWSRKDSADAQF